MSRTKKNPLELVVMGANPHRRRRMSNPMGNFSESEKMHLIQMGTKISDISTAGDVRRAKRQLEKYNKLRRDNPFAGRKSNPVGTLEDTESSQAEEARDGWEGFTESRGGSNFEVSHEPHIPSGNYFLMGPLDEFFVFPMPGSHQARTFPSTPLQWRAPKASVKCIASADRTKIYLCGDPYLTEAWLEKFGASQENICELGRMQTIAYVIRKYHDQLKPAERGKLFSWHHKFGQPLPVLFYDRRMKRLILQGGGYRVEDEGIVN